LVLQIARELPSSLSCGEAEKYASRPARMTFKKVYFAHQMNMKKQVYGFWLIFMGEGRNDYAKLKKNLLNWAYFAVSGFQSIGWTNKSNNFGGSQLEIVEITLCFACFSYEIKALYFVVCTLQLQSNSIKCSYL
jgi:hypothetical protein